MTKFNEETYDIQPPIDKTRLILEGISESCSEDLIRLYSTLILNPFLLDSFITTSRLKISLNIFTN